MKNEKTQFSKDELKGVAENIIKTGITSEELSTFGENFMNAFKKFEEKGEFHEEKEAEQDER